MHTLPVPIKTMLDDFPDSLEVTISRDNHDCCTITGIKLDDYGDYIAIPIDSFDVQPGDILRYESQSIIVRETRIGYYEGKEDTIEIPL